MDELSPDVLGELLRARGITVSEAVLAELVPAVRDMWELGAQLDRDLATLSREAGDDG